MSWANKTFHNTLTSKSSRRIWVAAFDNIPQARRPPPCPENLTEIGYANLLYNPRCMVCVGVYSTSHGLSVRVGLRRTACPSVLAGFCESLQGLYRELVFPSHRHCSLVSPDIEHRVTAVGGVRDQAVAPLSGGRLSSPSQVLPTPFPNGMQVFTKDLEQLVADLEAGDDKAAVVQRYRSALVVKHQVCCKFWSGLGPATLTYPKVYARVRTPGRDGGGGQKSRTCGCPRQTA